MSCPPPTPCPQQRGDRSWVWFWRYETKKPPFLVVYLGYLFRANTVVGPEILRSPVEVGSLSHYLREIWQLMNGKKHRNLITKAIHWPYMGSQGFFSILAQVDTSSNPWMLGGTARLRRFIGWFFFHLKVLRTWKLGARFHNNSI